MGSGILTRGLPKQSCFLLPLIRPSSLPCLIPHPKQSPAGSPFLGTPLCQPRSLAHRASRGKLGFHCSRAHWSPAKRKHHFYPWSQAQTLPRIEQMRHSLVTRHKDTRSFSRLGIFLLRFLRLVSNPPSELLFLVSLQSQKRQLLEIQLNQKRSLERTKRKSSKKIETALKKNMSKAQLSDSESPG